MPPSRLSNSERSSRQPASSRPRPSHRQHAVLDIAPSDSDEEMREGIEDEPVAVVPHQQQHAVCIHDTPYIATLSVPPSATQLSLSLYSPSSGVTHGRTFTAEYIHALTSKAHHPLSFAAFVTLLSSALCSASPAAPTAIPAPRKQHMIAASEHATLDVLSTSDIALIRSRVQPQSSTSSFSSSPLDSSPGKVYLVLTLPLTKARHVHLPLPLPNVAHTQQQQTAPSAPSALSVLTATISQLSVALKEARRDARQERDSRRQREESDKRERDSMRAEIAWLKDKVSEVERSGVDGSGGGGGVERHRAELVRAGGSVEALRTKLQREERQRKETEVLLAMWRTRCERAEAESARLRSARGDEMSRTRATSSRSSSSSRERVRGRSRERQAHPPLHRVVSSRSVSPSYMRPTSSTAAKQQYSPRSAASQTSPRSSVSHSSALTSRASSPGSRSFKPRRSPTPPPPAHYALTAHPPQHSFARNQRSASPNPASVEVRQFFSAASTSLNSVVRRSPPSRPTSRGSSRALSPASNSHSNSLTRHSPTPPRHQPHLHPPPRPTRHTPHAHMLSDNTTLENGRESDRWSVAVLGPGMQQVKESSQPSCDEQKESRPSEPPAGVLSDVMVGSSDVHSRLSALQKFLREEKFKSARRDV